MRMSQFEACLSEDEAIAWDCVKAVIENVLGKTRVAHSDVLINDMLNAFNELNVHMSLKIHLLRSHLDFFNKQLSTESDEHGERFHQQIHDMEKRYNGKKLDRMIADFCWYILQEDYVESDDED